MKPPIFNGLPEYVRITIVSQVRRLLSTPLFGYEDREDLTQDLLLFYLKRFYVVPNPPDEALVVHGLKQYATNLLVKRYHRRDFLYSSLSDNDKEEFSFFKETVSSSNNHALLHKIWASADEKEKAVIQKILQGESIDKISREMHISKKTIYKFFEKVRQKLK